ncbi:MAG: CpsD/CapB family tyrosine-protein kinase, partial [Phycisphaeraceae bacterium]
MGYIFDALNKKNGDAPEEQPTPVETSDSSSLVEDTNDSATGLADLLADSHTDNAQTDAHDDDTPLRLADLQFSVGTDENGNTVLDTDDTNATITHTGDAQPISFTQEVTSQSDALTEDISIDQPILKLNNGQKTSWWSKLLGRHFRGKVDDRLVAMTSPASAMSEEYRSIRTSILARHDNERHLVHTITSATPQEGKTITCVNLGMSFAELRNRKTIIIECDLRLPTFAKLLNCDANRPGLIDYLRGDVKVSEIIQQVENSALHIIAAGGMVSDEAVQLLSSQRMTHLIQGLRAKYDHVIIDTPPVLQLADAGILGSQSEEVLVVARMRRTPRPLVEQAINTLTSYNAQVSGIIATDNPRSRGRGYGYKYGYRYSYGY